MKSIVVITLFLLAGFGSRVLHAETSGTESLRYRLAAIEERRSGDLENMRELEQAALALLSEDSSDAEKGEVYAAIATMFANNALRQPAKLVEYCDKALRTERPVLEACRLYVYWGEALQRLAEQASNANAPTMRDALVPYLKGLELVAEKQTARNKRDEPPFERYRYIGPTNAPGYQPVRKKEAEVAAVRQEIVLQNELVDYRRIIMDKCVALFFKGRYSIEEFEETARGIVKKPGVLGELVRAIRNEQKTRAK